MTRLFIILAGFSVGIALTAGLATLDASAGKPAAAGAKNATITIQHQMRGCHAWSVNGGPYRAGLTARITHGATIKFINNDVMPHKLIKTSGSAVHFLGKAAMNHMSASTKVTFSHAGVYRFTTKAGEDYPGMAMKTVGEDNVLRLVVKVS